MQTFANWYAVVVSIFYWCATFYALYAMAYAGNNSKRAFRIILGLVLVMLGVRLSIWWFSIPQPEKLFRVIASIFDWIGLLILVCVCFRGRKTDDQKQQ